MRAALVISACLWTCACVDVPQAQRDGRIAAVAAPNRDAQPGGLFHDFLFDGKFDAAGHPQGARVFDSGEECAPTTGAVLEGLGVGAQLKLDPAGVLCGAAVAGLGNGTFALNARAVLFDAPADESTPVLHITVSSGGGEVASRTLTALDFGELAVERDLAVTFRHHGAEDVRFDVSWTGEAAVRLNYVEIFRATPRLVVSPGSHVLDPDTDGTFAIELQDPPEELSFRVWCDDVDLSDTLTALLDSGAATRADTDFRTLVEVPASLLLDGCAPTTRVRVEALATGFVRETSRVTFYAEPPACDWADDAGGARVLLSGFEPFPAGSDSDNSSREAVAAFAADPIAGIDLMTMVLPVEYDAAAALLADVIERCSPDVVVGFGQGREMVDVETIAYNRKDSAAVAGGIPDNRGVVYGGDAIVVDGAAERTTELPVDAILADLELAGIAARSSTDPGRYVCNNLFYALIGLAEEDDLVGGFVHLPRIPTVGDAERAMLRETVATVVDRALQAN